MAYKRRRFSRRPRSGRRRRRYGVRSMRINPRAPHLEIKTIDIDYQNALLDDTGTLTVCNLINEGAGFTNRIGRQIQMKSLLLRYNIGLSASNAAALTTQQLARLIVVYDRQTNGAAPTVADILRGYDYAGTAFAAANVATFSPNPNNFTRFRILLDREFSLGPIGIMGARSGQGFDYQSPTSMAQDGSFHGTVFIKLRRLVTQYKSNTVPPTINDIASGGLYVITCSTAASAGTIKPYFCSFNTRLRFYD